MKSDMLAFEQCPTERKISDFQPLDVKTGSTQPKLSAACFVVQSCLADADFVVFSNYCLIGTRHMPSASGVYICSAVYAFRQRSTAIRME